MQSPPTLMHNEQYGRFISPVWKLAISHYLQLNAEVKWFPLVGNSFCRPPKGAYLTFRLLAANKVSEGFRSSLSMGTDRLHSSHARFGNPDRTGCTPCTWFSPDIARLGVRISTRIHIHRWRWPCTILSLPSICLVVPSTMSSCKIKIHVIAFRKAEFMGPLCLNCLFRISHMNCAWSFQILKACQITTPHCSRKK